MEDDLHIQELKLEDDKATLVLSYSHGLLVQRILHWRRQKCPRIHLLNQTSWKHQNTKLKQFWDNDVIIVMSQAHFRKMTSLWSKNNRSVVEWIERMLLKR